MSSVTHGLAVSLGDTYSPTVK